MGKQPRPLSDAGTLSWRDSTCLHRLLAPNRSPRCLGLLIGLPQVAVSRLLLSASHPCGPPDFRLTTLPFFVHVQCLHGLSTRDHTALYIVLVHQPTSVSTPQVLEKRQAPRTERDVKWRSSGRDHRTRWESSSPTFETKHALGSPALPQFRRLFPQRLLPSWPSWLLWPPYKSSRAPTRRRPQVSRPWRVRVQPCTTLHRPPTCPAPHAAVHLFGHWAAMSVVLSARRPHWRFGTNVWPGRRPRAALPCCAALSSVCQ